VAWAFFVLTALDVGEPHPSGVWIGSYRGTLVDGDNLADCGFRKESTIGEKRVNHGQQWRCICIITLTKALLLWFSSSCPGCFGETPDLRYSPCVGFVFLEQMLARGALRCSGVDFAVLTAVGLGGVAPWSTSCWRSVRKYTRKMEEPFGTCGGINDRPGEDLCFDMHYWVGLWKIAEDTSVVCAWGALSRVSYLSDDAWGFRFCWWADKVCDRGTSPGVPILKVVGGTLPPYLAALVCMFVISLLP
jgi:hypothetical protein